MTNGAGPIRTLILGAAGRDFHNFNVCFRYNPSFYVVAFTAAQIPGIAGRRYPPELTGSLYPDGIEILPEDDLEEICRAREIDQVVFAYSDLSHQAVMHLASRSLAAGADFVLLGPMRTMIEARRPVIAVSALRTGCGKSQIARWIAARARNRGLRVAAVRHPMPYGDLAVQAVQRFAGLTDLDAADCTLEEREEYEPHIAAGGVVYAGVDYGAILARAEEEADLVLWDGGNNDFPFYRPNLHIAVADALRPNHVTSHHPGEAVLRMANLIIINKADSADNATLAELESALRGANSSAPILRAASPVTLDDPGAVRGRAVLVVEDGPTLTHGGMAEGAGAAAARAAGAARLVDPRSSAAPAIADVFARYPHIGPVLPAMGYGAGQLAALVETINASDAELVVAGTPINLAANTQITKPVVRARYEFAEIREPGLGAAVDAFLDELTAP